jgi:tetratricopeptide (TPR) repeat protein
LELSVKEDPTDDRNAFYLAREYFFYNRLEEAAAEFRRHLSLERAVWKPERAASMRYLAKCDPDNTRMWLHAAVSEDPGRREALVERAQHAHNSGDWQLCKDRAEEALAITEKPLDYLCEEFAWGWLPYDLAAISSWWLGNRREALDYELEALRLAPNDKRMIENVELMVKEIHNEEITAATTGKSDIDDAPKVKKRLKRNEK